MTDQQVVSQESVSPQRRKVFLLISIVAAGLALCTVIKSIICNKFGDNCLCQAASDQADGGCCSTSDED